MTNEEYKAKLALMISDPDNAQSVASGILDDIAKDRKEYEDAATVSKTNADALSAKIKELTAQVNKYKAAEFMGSLGAGNPEPFDPVANAINIAAKVINPHYGEEDKK